MRRPFDAPGRPSVDIGGTEWPKMSRTMTHVSECEMGDFQGQAYEAGCGAHEGVEDVKADGQALTEMSMEERIHMAQVGFPPLSF